jgi:two-component system KDP operon response regulator KdpE
MATQDSTKLVILVIEDYRDSREMLRLVLETSGYKVIAAATGNEALSLAASNPVDLVLTDLGLPDMDGIAVVRRLRELNERFSRIPTIMLTAFERNECYEPAMDAGCTEVLTKPVDFDVLQSLIEKLLKDGCDDR